jgi:hypothetical protein
MAQEQVASPKPASWTKIFTAFKVALDLKKMALAAVGILCVFVGWWLLSWGFYSARAMPQWKDYETINETKKESWTYFKAKRNSWNLLHELAGSPTDHTRIDAADIANSHEEYEILHGWEELRAKNSPLAQIQATDDATKHEKLFLVFRTELFQPRFKPSGRLCTPPFSEDRGDNPYLIIARAIKSAGDSSGSSTHFLKWLIHEEAPVVLEPLCKLLLPLVYMFDARAGGWDRLYLCLVMLWTLAVWGFFGGAICRIAAVQIARNERITLSEAIAFARERFVSYFAAPVFPLVLIAILTLLLIIFGWVEWIPWFGDIVVAGLFWPIVLLLGFIMTIVLVGMIGWPLMVATISTEGSDSFDALSRSYSYVYQAPWQYLWYNFLAMLYGAVLIFFVGFMASLMVYTGKWAVSSAPGLASDNVKSDREPSYLFSHAPTSFRWRDLLIGSSKFVEPVDVTLPSGNQVSRLEFKKEYTEAMSAGNQIGAWMVAFWLWIVFLLMLGFGYSYFWTASTIVYFLMRQDVDDTEFDEVHLEDEDMADPFAKPAAPAATPVSAPAKPGTISLNVVDPPPTTAIVAEPPPHAGDEPPPLLPPTI